MMEPWLNLVCSVYLNKHSTLYAGQTLERFRDSFMTSPIDDECARLLGWVGLGDKECLASTSDWCHFVRAVSFHKETAKRDFEANIMPSMAALDRHKRRAEYVLHMAYSAPFSTCSQLPCFQAYGWVVDKDGNVGVDWDDNQMVSYLTGNDKGCTCKKSKCTSCKCARNNQPCTIRCACKDCKNPHNKHSTVAVAPNPNDNNQDYSQSESDTSDAEQLLVEREVEYDSDEYDLQI